MRKDRLMKMIRRQQAISDVVAGAMRDYAIIHTGRQWRTSSFVFETDYVLSMLAQAGYKIIRRPEYVVPSRSNEPVKPDVKGT